MKAVALALLCLVALNAQAQDQPAQQHAKARKLEWIGLGALAGGISAAVAGAARRETEYVSTYSSNGNCSTFQSPGAIATTCVTVATASGSPPLTLPGGTLSTGTTTGTITLSTPQRRVTNWKITGPAIAGAGAGAVLITIGHSHAKTAELSIRPDGAVKLAFKW